MEISKIDPELFQVNVREWPIEAAESRLFSGRDSSGKQVAFKVYPTLTPEEVQSYTEVTNRLAETVNDSNMVAHLEVGGVENDYLVHIVPISIFGLVTDPDKPDKDWPCTLAPFIEGPTLFDVDKNFLSRHATLKRQNPLSTLAENLAKISKRNIRIIPWNVKPVEKDGKRILEITDLCGSIKSL